MIRVELAVSEEDFLGFLNEPAEAASGKTSDLEKTRTILRECVKGAVQRYKKCLGSFDQRRQRIKGKDRMSAREEVVTRFAATGEFFVFDIWKDLAPLVKEIYLTVEPSAFFRDESLLLEERADEFEKQKGFRCGFRISAKKPHAGFILKFLDCLERFGPERFFVCLECGKIGIGRTDQKFCSDRGQRGRTSCRTSYHEKKKSPAAKRTYKQKWRKQNPNMG